MLQLTCRIARYSVWIFGPVFADGTDTPHVYGSLVSDEFFSCPDEIWHVNEFRLVSTRWCQTSHQQCHISLSSWRFRGDSPVEPVTYAIWGRIVMVIIFSGLKHLRLSFVGYLTDRMYQKNLHTIQQINTATQCELHFYGNSNQDSE